MNEAERDKLMQEQNARDRERYDDEETNKHLQEGPQEFESLTEALLNIVEPTKMKHDKYHAYLVKELALSQLSIKNELDVTYAMEVFSVIDFCVLLEAFDAADMYHAELIAFLMLKRSIGAKQLDALTPGIREIRKPGQQQPGGLIK